MLAAAPFAPRGGDDGALLPSGEQKPSVLLPAEAVGYGTVTPDLQREIDVVDQGLALGRVSARTSSSSPPTWSGAPTSPGSGTV